jgi:hypothetical protein
MLKIIDYSSTFKISIHHQKETAMALYETTYFSNQKTQTNMASYRPKINEKLSELRRLTSFGGYESVSSGVARGAIKGACGNPHTGNNAVYETSIGGQWRIFFAQGHSGGVVALMIGHLQGNVLQQP